MTFVVDWALNIKHLYDSIWQCCSETNIWFRPNKKKKDVCGWLVGIKNQIFIYLFSILQGNSSHHFQTLCESEWLRPTESFISFFLGELLGSHIVDKGEQWTPLSSPSAWKGSLCGLLLPFWWLLAWPWILSSCQLQVSGFVCLFLMFFYSVYFCFQSLLRLWKS